MVSTLFSAMEVVVSLIPIVGTDGEQPRNFVLNRESLSMPVGRSSKSHRKGPQPAVDNASFDCPIMSRQHARFRASTVSRTLNLTDLGSTHGTFLDNEKIPPETDVLIKMGQIITFGTRVVNDSVTYPPKTFRVEYHWRPFRRVLPPSSSTFTALTARSSVPVISTPNPGKFSIPIDDDDDEDEVELCSIRSVPSVQVLDSNIRTTYSVPTDIDTDSESENGHDDDILEISSSSSSASELAEPAEQTASSNITTPEQKVPNTDMSATKVNQAENLQASNASFSSVKIRQSQNLEEARQVSDVQGSSQTHPINLEVETSNMVIESDEDGPDVLPIQVSRKRSAIADLLNDRPPSSSGMPKTSSKSFIVPLMANTSHTDPKAYDGQAGVRSEPDDRDAIAPPNSLPAFTGSHLIQPEKHTPSPSDAALIRFLHSNQPKQASPNNVYSPYTPYPTCSTGPALGMPEMHGSTVRCEYLRLPPVGSQPTMIEPNYSGAAGIATGWPEDGSPYLEVGEPHQSGSTLARGPEQLHLQSSVSSWETPAANMADEHTIRPDISNLVNAYHAEFGKSLKRKAEEMNRDEATSGPSQESFSSSNEKTQAPVHDAQPRELPATTETEEETFVTQSESGIAVVSSTKSITKEIPKATDEPPRKKNKTSSRLSAPSTSSLGIGKFVSGVCLGVVGAAVAFIATIPASVHEEALREL